MRLLLRAGLREMARHPAQLALALAGIALGVAVGVAVDLANESARRAFRLSTEATSGRATHVIASGSAGLDERLLVRLRTEAGVRAAAPVVEGVLTLPGRPGRVLRMLGVDPFSEAPFRPFTAASAGPAEPLERFLLEPGAVLLARATADELGLEVDARFPVGAGPRRAELQLVGRLDPEDDLARAALASIVVADIATAQETLGRAGRLDRIELVLPEGAAGDRIAARIHALLPPDARLEPVGTRTAALESLTRAFRFNLQALALLALLCGAFLIFNTTTFAVVRRRALYGRLRAAGAGERELLFAVLGEAAVVGAVGAAIGVGLGVLLGRGLVALVLATVSDLYFTLTVRELALPPATLAAGSALGVGASVAAALLPALEATRSPLRAALAVSALESRAAGLARRGALWGSGVVALGALLVALPTRSLPAAFAGFLFLVVGAAMFVPLLLGGSARLLARAPGLVVRQTARGVERALARTAPAVAALAVAVAVSLSVAITIASFRTAVVDWLNATLVGDLYLSAPSGPGSPAAAFPEELALRFAALPGVERVHLLHVAGLPREGAEPAPTLLGVDTDPDAFDGFQLRAGERETARAAVAAGAAALVSEPLAERRGLRLGDTVRIPTPSGDLVLPIAGIHVDYGSERGAIVIANPLFVRRFPGAAVAAFSLRLAPDSDLTAVARAAERATAPLAIEARSNRDLKRFSMVIFDRTFRVTGVLRSLALVVAALGIAAALAALELERSRHFALLRALGTTRAGVARLALAECALLGFVSGAAALPLGAALSAILIGVVQRRSFGWSFPLELPARPFVESLALAVGAALVSGALAALRVARRPPAEALREE